jgi:membrane associated rhomboid family serine protease
MTWGADGESGTPAVADRCYRHPHREALIRCTRCDRPICPECMRPAAVGFHCPDDVALANERVRAPRTVVGATLRQSPPYVTFGLLAANVIIYVITAYQSVRGFTHVDSFLAGSLFDRWQLVPQVVHDRDQYYRLLTAAFLHVSLLHVGSNMLALFFIGPALESVLGRWRFAATYLLSALGGSTAIYAFGDVHTPVVGASGAIFGLFGACLVLARKMRIDLQWLIGILVLNFVLTFSIAGISKLGHLGGFVVGVLCGLAIGGLPKSQGRLSTRVQAGGLAAIGLLCLAVVVWRTATFS